MGHALHLSCTRDHPRVLPWNPKVPPPPLELPAVMANLQHAGHHFQTVSCELWKVNGPKVRIKKDCSVCFSVDAVVTNQDIVVGFDRSGIDIDSIISTQRKASNNTWVVTIDSPVFKDAPLNKQSVTSSGRVVFLGDCENKVSIVKLHELPTELPDSVIIGRLSHYGHVFSFQRDRIAKGIYNGVCTTRMIIDRPIPGQTFIAGEFAHIWYPGQPKICRICGAEGHLAALCKSQRCFNCEQSGHRSDDCPLLPLCRVCLADSHPTSQCPYIYYGSNVLFVKVSASTYLQAAERGKQAEETKCQQAMEERVKRKKNEECERKEKECERKEKEWNERGSVRSARSWNVKRRNADRKRNAKRKNVESRSARRSKKGGIVKERTDIVDRDYDRSSHCYSHDSSSESDDDSDRG